MSTGLVLGKEKVRKEILADRRKLNEKKVRKLSSQITSRFLRQKKFKQFKNYLLYLPISNEVDTLSIIHFFFQNNKNVFVPAYHDNKWVFTKLIALDDLKLNKYKTLQPRTVQAVHFEKIGLAIIPAVAFSKTGIRLGFGMGVYDKLLKGFEGTLIGFCYGFQVLNNLAAEAHDLKMDYIVTEKEIIDLSSI